MAGFLGGFSVHWQKENISFTPPHMPTRGTKNRAVPSPNIRLPGQPFKGPASPRKHQKLFLKHHIHIRLQDCKIHPCLEVQSSHRDTCTCSHFWEPIPEGNSFWATHPSKVVNNMVWPCQGAPTISLTGWKKKKKKGCKTWIENNIPISPSYHFHTCLWPWCHLLKASQESSGFVLLLRVETEEGGNCSAPLPVLKD